VTGPGVDGPWLPPAFADLEPFAATWCLATEPERWERRRVSSMPELEAFHAVAAPRMEAALDHLDRFPLDALPPAEQHLQMLVHSFIMVSFPVEVWRQVLPLHAGVARIDRISGPTP